MSKKKEYNAEVIMKRSRLFIELLVMVLILGFLSIFVLGYVSDLHNELHTVKNSLEDTKHQLVMEKERSTKVVEKLEKVDIQEYVDGWTIKLLSHLASLDINSEAYYIRNEYLYRNKDISYEEATYRSLWTWVLSEIESIDPYLELAVQIQESDTYHFDPKDLDKLNGSSAGAIGIAQIMPRTARIYNGDRRIFEENVRISVELLADTKRMYKNDLRLMLGHYNGGSNPEKKIKEYKETADYVVKVPAIYNNLKNTYRK